MCLGHLPSAIFYLHFFPGGTDVVPVKHTLIEAAGTKFTLGLLLTSNIPLHSLAFPSTTKKITLICFLSILIKQSGIASIWKR